jgi:hypothetical protein
MTQRSHILQELKELNSSIESAISKNSYHVPVGYFDTLATDIMIRIKAMEAKDTKEELQVLSPLLASTPKHLPYTIPTGYFESLDEMLPISMSPTENADQELETLSPMLSGLKKVNPYTLPDGYFEKLVATKNTEQKAKVVSMNPVRWMRYAVAAVIIAFVSVGTFFLVKKDNQVDPNTASFAWVEKNMKKVSTNDIDEFLQMADDNTSISAANTAPKQEVKELLKNVSDEEIGEFLQDTGLGESGTDILN